jgi:hypothetical protein
MSTGIEEERLSETTEDEALPLSISTALEVAGTPPVQLLAVVQTPVPPFQTEVWADTRGANESAMSSANTGA